MGYVIGGLKQMWTKHKLSAAKRKQLERVITYLENHRSNMKYDEYRVTHRPDSKG